MLEKGSYEYSMAQKLNKAGVTWDKCKKIVDLNNVPDHFLDDNERTDWFSHIDLVLEWFRMGLETNNLKPVNKSNMICSSLRNKRDFEADLKNWEKEDKNKKNEKKSYLEKLLDDINSECNQFYNASPIGELGVFLRLRTCEKALFPDEIRHYRVIFSEAKSNEKIELYKKKKEEIKAGNFYYEDFVHEVKYYL